MKGAKSKENMPRKAEQKCIKELDAWSHYYYSTCGQNLNKTEYGVAFEEIMTKFYPHLVEDINFLHQ